jgi:hypothetical protein
MLEEAIAELINRRRRQILVHSVIYYKLNTNLISDHTWMKWAQELVSLQQQYPEIAKKCPYSVEFEGFDGSTGFNLPLADPWAVNKAYQLLEFERSMKNFDDGKGIYNG